MDENDGVVPIEGAVPVIMLDNDSQAVAMMIVTSEHNVAPPSGMNWSPNWNGDIEASMKDQLAGAERIEPPSNS